ncbi:MAG: hypothetical protein K1X72_21520 [Pyrinomonadaceae bacterium]|nr:hypothetical protein [Pyrinomonadaceae bacterium]
MNLYYAMGGGLGHLTRAVAFLRGLGIENDSIILSASAFLGDKRVVGNIRTILVEKSLENDRLLYQKYLQNLFAELKPQKIFIDSFPLGIVGEFVRFEFDKSVEINYLARHLRWKNYSALIDAEFPRFDKTFLLEDLEKEHLNFVETVSHQIIPVELNYPPSDLLPKDFETYQSVLKTKLPFWLIVHSGNELEISELVEFAAEMREIEAVETNLILISPTNFLTTINNLFQFDIYPASVLFEKAERIFSAAGFNVMKQTEPFKDKHFFIPFERRYDNQFWRAKIRREK